MAGDHDDGIRHAQSGQTRPDARVKTRSSWTLFAPLGACALLAGWIALSAANMRLGDFSSLLYGLAGLIVFSDALDFGLRLYVHRRHTAAAADPRRSGMSPLSIDLTAGGSPGPPHGNTPPARPSAPTF